MVGNVGIHNSLFFSVAKNGFHEFFMVQSDLKPKKQQKMVKAVREFWTSSAIGIWTKNMIKSENPRFLKKNYFSQKIDLV
jgi:hypothetical protein